MSQREGWAALVAAAEHFRGASGADVVLLAAWAGPGGVAYAQHGAGPLGAAARRYLRHIVAAHRAGVADDVSADVTDASPHPPPEPPPPAPPRQPPPPPPPHPPRPRRRRRRRSGTEPGGAPGSPRAGDTGGLFLMDEDSPGADGPSEESEPESPDEGSGPDEGPEAAPGPRGGPGGPPCARSLPVSVPVWGFRGGGDGRSSDEDTGKRPSPDLERIAGRMRALARGGDGGSLGERPRRRLLPAEPPGAL